MGAFNTAMGEKMGDSVSTGTLEVNEGEYENPPFSLGESHIYPITVSMTDMDDAHIGMVITDSLASTLLSQFADEGSSGMDDMEGMDLNSDELDDLSKVADDFGGSNDFGDDSLGGPTTIMSSSSSPENVYMLLDVEMDVCIELGKSELTIKRILELSPGSIIELDRLAGEPVDLLVNEKVVAKGEVVVVDENFGIRLVSLVSPEERLKSI